MRFIEFLVEGIVRRTSQHDKRTEGDITVIGNAISDWSSLVSQRRLETFEDVFASLAAFLETTTNISELDWYFNRSLQELRIKPKDQQSFKSAWIYLAQRYNQIESKDEESVQEWYYDIVDKVREKAGLQQDDYQPGIGWQNPDDQFDDEHEWEQE